MMGAKKCRERPRIAICVGLRIRLMSLKDEGKSGLGLQQAQCGKGRQQQHVRFGIRKLQQGSCEIWTPPVCSRLFLLVLVRFPLFFPFSLLAMDMQR
ncbi:hypothetical protein HDV57DRAFT_46943 [Trichoderma longibrachiatum]|uniref:Uncharacterized protein n=1 Tax=Trichoderma longibrachiatum ATCC 18648 TaxID=983965 RepID=A0A2T4CH42_TRILO|nr:hypothetical protein M440DRAFT_1001502 [Trichoderma longibrachiatum ATCC 18648]